MKVSISDVKDYMMCQRYARYKHVQQRSSLKRAGDALIVGTAWHKVMEVYFATKDKEAASAELERQVQDMLDNGRGTAAESLSRLGVWKDQWTIPEDWEICSVEHVLEAPIGKHTLQGRLDAIVKWNGLYWHVQHKTVDQSRPLTAYWQKMERDWHENAYTYLAEANDYRPYGGTLLLVARKYRKKDSEDLPVISHSFLTRTPEMIDDVVHDLNVVLDEWDARPFENFVQNRDACFGAFGNSPCVYLGVCNGMQSLDDETLFMPTESRYA